MCDRATIIRRGRLVAEGTIDELLASYGTSGFVDPRARRRRRARRRTLLERSGLLARAARRRPPGGHRRRSHDGEQISRPLAEAGIYVSELRTDRADLEQVFLSLTTDHDDAALPQLEPIS